MSFPSLVDPKEKTLRGAPAEVSIMYSDSNPEIVRFFSELNKLFSTVSVFDATGTEGLPCIHEWGSERGGDRAITDAWARASEDLRSDGELTVVPMGEG